MHMGLGHPRLLVLCKTQGWETPTPAAQAPPGLHTPPLPTANFLGPGTLHTQGSMTQAF